MKSLPFAGLVGLACKRVAIDGIVEVGDRLDVVALSLIDQPARVVCLCALGIEFDRLVQVG